VVKSGPGLGGGVAAPEMNIERPISNEKQTSIAELGVAAPVFYPVSSIAFGLYPVSVFVLLHNPLL
jgi:hypothetical protein